MIRLLIKIWPAFIPIALFMLWYLLACRKHKKGKRETKPTVKEGPWLLTILSSIAIAIICIIFSGLNQESIKGNYTPAYIQDGKIVEGSVSPK